MWSCILYYFFVVLLCPFVLTLSPREECKKAQYDDFLASIQSGGEARCLGVILNKNTVLTTAKCVTDIAFRRQLKFQFMCLCFDALWITYGLRDSNLMGLVCSQRIKVEKVFIHQNYTFPSLNGKVLYDAAILRTKGNMELRKDFKPAPLPTSRNTNLMIDICEPNSVVVGWWMNSTGENPPSKTICLGTTIGNWTQCSRGIRPKISLMCTEDKGKEIHDFCKGHYGAPLLCREKSSGQIQVRGLFSHRYQQDEDCKKDVPFFYTRVDDILNFVKNPEAFSRKDV